jgi:hypothetical protein
MENYKNHPLYRIHNIDSAMDSLWQFYKTRFIALFAISVVMSGILQYATVFMNINEIQQMTDPAEVLNKLKELLVPFSVIMVISLLFSTLLSYYILHKPLETDSGIFQMILRSLRYFIPYLVIIVILAFAGSIALVLGLFVFVVGVLFAAVYIGMISLFILPVMMNEDSDIGTTIARTVKLSHSGFWSNMGWAAVFFILIIILSLVLSGLLMIPFAGSFFRIFSDPQDPSRVLEITSNPVFQVLSALINALTLPLLPIFSYILYFNGKAREDEKGLKEVYNPEEKKVTVEDLYAKPREENDRFTGTDQKTIQ